MSSKDSHLGVVADAVAGVDDAGCSRRRDPRNFGAISLNSFCVTAGSMIYEGRLAGAIAACRALPRVIIFSATGRAALAARQAW